MALFSPFSPPGQGRHSVWLFMSVWESELGAAAKPTIPSLLRGLGWAGLGLGACHWCGSVKYTCTHTQPLTNY